MITENDWKRLESIAAYCTGQTVNPTPALSTQDRYDAALDAIIEAIPDDGTIPPGNELFQAAWRGIANANYEAGKHLRRWAFWAEPRGSSDPLVENITDRIGVWQLAWMLTETEWRAIWGTAYAPHSQSQAAHIAGLTQPTLNKHLMTARRRCREAWICPDETARPMYRPAHRGVTSGFQAWQRNQRKRAKLAQEAA